MALVQHLQRRKSVYCFRRRLPRHLAHAMGRAHLQISLGTRDGDVAKRIVPFVDAAYEELMQAGHLTGQQLDCILRIVAKRELQKLDLLAAVAKTSAAFNAEQAMQEDKRAGWTFKLLHAKGIHATIGQADVERMKADGLSDKDIEGVLRHLDMLWNNRGVPTPRGKLVALIEEQGAPVTEASLAQAQTVYFRSMHLALSQHERRYRGDYVEDSELIGQLFRDNVTTPENRPVQPAQPVHQPASMENGALAATESHPIRSMTELAEKLIAKRDQEKVWDIKAQKQLRSIVALLVRYLTEKCGIKSIEQVGQAHVARFVDFLRNEIFRFYGRSEKDFARSIDELTKIARTKEAEAEAVRKELEEYLSKRDVTKEGKARERDLRRKAQKWQGIEGATLNRHLTFIGQLFRYVRAQHIALTKEIDFTELRARKSRNRRAREERSKIEFNVVEKLFQDPVFTGTNSSNGGSTADVVHRALYFVPLLIYYGGARREEFCGLKVKDVIVDNGSAPYLHIAPNGHRRIKNAQSQRNIPLHPEIIRLGFLDYVARIRKLGYDLVFQDLYSPSTKSPLGDRFSKQFRPLLDDAGVTEGGVAAHAIRHLFGDQLKKRRVREEDRGELLGHVGKSETSERYCDALEVEALMEFVMKIPTDPTRHLTAYPITLESWVEKCEDPPAMRSPRRKCSKGTTPA